MRVLIFGLGAVGVAHGLALQRAGATVGALVREHHRERLEAGISVREIGLFQRRGTWHTLKPSVVHTDPSQVDPTAWDLILVTLPSDALRAPTVCAWITDLSSLPMILLSPGVDDKAHVTALRGGAEPTSGFIGFLSWHAPLPGEEGPEHTALWLPVAAPSAFAGPEAARYVAWVKKGGMPAKVVDEVGTRSIASTVLLPFVAALESVGWRLARMGGAHGKLFRQASSEALEVYAHSLGVRPPVALRWIPHLLHPVLLRVAHALAPLDLETYLQVHFSKVGGQTSHALAGWIERAQELKFPSASMVALQQARGAKLDA